jgi:hypothetical protein
MMIRQHILRVQGCSFDITSRCDNCSCCRRRFVVERATNGCSRALLLLRFPRLQPQHVVCANDETKVRTNTQTAARHVRDDVLLTAATHCDFWVGVTLAVWVLKSAAPSFLKWKVTMFGSSVLNDSCLRSVNLYLTHACMTTSEIKSEQKCSSITKNNPSKKRAAAVDNDDGRGRSWERHYPTQQFTHASASQC